MINNEILHRLNKLQLNFIQLLKNYKQKTQNFQQKTFLVIFYLKKKSSESNTYLFLYLLYTLYQLYTKSKMSIESIVTHI